MFQTRSASVLHAVLGNPDEALSNLAAAQSRGYFIKSEQRNSEFDLIRGLPAFQALVR